KTIPMEKILSTMNSMMSHMESLENKLKMDPNNNKQHTQLTDSNWVIDNIVSIAETNCTENKEKWFIEGGNKYRGHWSSDGMGAVMGDFNAVPSPSINRNNNNQFNIPESEIFSILTGKDLIDSYKITHPDSSGFTWKRDNSREQSRIDAIWISQQWGKKIIEYFTEQLELVTKSDHKIIQLKIKKIWQIHSNREIHDNIGPKKYEELLYKFKEQSIHFQTIARAEKKKKNFKKIQKAIEERWENLKEIEVSIDELEETIHLLPNKKVAGQLGLQYEWFKHLPNEDIETLRDIINMAFELNDISEE
ncbi:10438_t:CDS:2, partial [Diversispora eburnea]